MTAYRMLKIVLIHISPLIVIGGRGLLSLSTSLLNSRQVRRLHCGAIHSWCPIDGTGSTYVRERPAVGKWAWYQQALSATSSPPNPYMTASLSPRNEAAGVRCRSVTPRGVYIQSEAYCVRMSLDSHPDPLYIRLSDGTRCSVARRFGMSSVSNHLLVAVVIRLLRSERCVLCVTDR